MPAEELGAVGKGLLPPLGQGDKGEEVLKAGQVD
jgi:hypothetical protein